MQHNYSVATHVLECYQSANHDHIIIIMQTIIIDITAIHQFSYTVSKFKGSMSSNTLNMYIMYI